MKKNIIIALVLLVFIIIGITLGIVFSKGKSNNQNDTNINSKVDTEKLSDFSTEGIDVNITEEIIEEVKPQKIIPSTINAIYSTGWSAGSKIKRDAMIKSLKDYGYNAVVIDIKDEAGQISYKSNVELAINMSASRNMISDIESVIKDFKDNGIYVIGRIVTFKDPIYAKNNIEHAYKYSDGTTWKDYSGNNWPNPYDEISWEYPIALAKEAATLGFDEIQFDYIRFPSSEGKVRQIAFGFDSETKTKSDVINSFLTRVMSELNDYDVVVSADVFGITTKRDGDFENIGQDFAKIAQIVDVICPMVYPSHYGYGEYNVSKPDMYPYEIIYGSLKDAKDRLVTIPSDVDVAKIRPYLQDFTASWLGKGNYLNYQLDEVTAQIQACYDLEIYDFILWDPNNKYCFEALINAEKIEDSLASELPPS